MTARNYDDMVRYFAEGRVELGTISPGPYVLAQRLNPGVRALLTELSWNSDRTARQDSYQGLILTLASRDDINDLADLAGKAFGFVTAESTSGFIIPNAVLRQHGIDYQTAFASHVFLGSHPRVTDALVAGSIDAGATWDFNLAQAIEKHGNRFKIISRTAIPNLLIAVHPSLPDPVTEQIKTALLGIDPQLLAGLPTAGYVERPESFYDDIRAIVDLLPR